MKEEILFLNLLRFFAALNVVGSHKFETLLSMGYLPAFLQMFSSLAQYGYLGVDLFFMISGFVIMLSSEGRTVGQFALARFMRLYPMFWVCISITTIIAVLANTQHISLGQYLAGLTMVPDTFGAFAYIDGVYWTLEIELRFYFFVALLLGLRKFMKVDIQKVAVFLSFMLAIHMMFHVAKSTSVLAILFGIFYTIYWTGYAQYFLAGILFYGIYQNSKRKYHYVAIFLCYLVAIVQAFSRTYESNNKIIVALFITTFFILFLILSLRKITNTSFSFLGKHYRKIIITLGAITFPLYLLQNSVIGILLQLFTTYKIPPYLASPLLFFLVLIILLLVNRIDVYINRVVLKRKHEVSTTT